MIRSLASPRAGGPETIPLLVDPALKLPEQLLVLAASLGMTALMLTLSVS